MVSSFAIHYGNRKTLDELLTIDPREREGGPVAIQLFGHDPEIMRSAAAHVAAHRRRPDRPQHGLPGAEGDEDRRGRRAAVGPRHGGRGGARRSRGLGAAGDRQAARRGGRGGAAARVDEAGVAGITFHPRTIKVRHKGTPDYDLAAALVESLPVPVIVTGGMDDAGPRPLGVRVHRLRGGDARARRRSATRGCSRRCSAHALGRADARGDPRRMALGGRPRGGASGRRPRRALPAQVPSVVRSNGSARRTPCRTRSSALATLDEQRAIIADFGATMLGRAAV